MSKKIYPKELILDTALEMAKKVGFDKLSIRGIARKLNISVSPVYDAYDSMHDIIQAIIIKVIDDNAASDTYFERNHGILSYALQYPILYRDIQLYTRRYKLDTTHPQDIRQLMKQESKYKGLPNNVLRSLNFDIILYISALAQLKLSDVVKDFDNDFYHNALDSVSELLLIGYSSVVKGEKK